MIKSFSHQFIILTKLGLKIEFTQLKQLLSSFLFALTLLLLFSFAVGELETNVKIKVVLSEVFVCSFLVLQFVHQRIFQAEESDRALDILLTTPLSLSIVYLSKVFLAILFCTSIISPFLVFIQLIHNIKVLNLFIFTVVLLVVIALSCIGILLSQMTEKSRGKDLLFPLLYFPLTSPVLIAGVQASLSHFEIQNTTNTNLWLGVLLCFSLIYLSLGILLFEELFGLD